MTHTQCPGSAKWCGNLFATLRRLNLILCVLLQVATTASLAIAADETRVFPGFRHVDPVANPGLQAGGPAPVLLADEDFAPWSFVDDDGALAGISVDLARAACAKAGLACDIRPAAFAELRAGLQKQDVAGVVTGLRADASASNQLLFTRPYFRSLGRFVVRAGSPLSTPDTRTLAGRRVGFVANTAHARFVEGFYPRSALTPFETPQAMLEALRTGQVDAAFGDTVQLSYWLAGDASKDCCVFLGKSFLHRDTFSRSLTFTFAAREGALRDRIDNALDRLESDGTTATIFARYLPGSLW
jgi:polar amino acid transport system substrate-binding protein